MHIIYYAACACNVGRLLRVGFHRLLGIEVKNARMSAPGNTVFNNNGADSVLRDLRTAPCEESWKVKTLGDPAFAGVCYTVECVKGAVATTRAFKN